MIFVYCTQFLLNLQSVWKEEQAWNLASLKNWNAIILLALSWHFCTHVMHRVKGHQAGPTWRKWKFKTIWYFSSDIWVTESLQTSFQYQLVGPGSLEKIILWCGSRFNVFNAFFHVQISLRYHLSVSRNGCCKETAWKHPSVTEKEVSLYCWGFFVVDAGENHIWYESY